MKKQSTLFLLCFGLLLLISLPSVAQNISNVQARLEGDNIIVTYDLSGDPDSRFNVTLYSSADNFSSPLEQVSGDVGDDQAPGFSKRITWSAKSELGVYQGQLTFEVRALTTFSPLRITRPVSGDSFKPGSNMPIRWEGGASGATMKLELMKNNLVDQTIGTTPNSGSYSWTVPASVESDGKYQVRLYDTSDAAAAVLSGEFNFKFKSGGGNGLWWKIGIPVVAGGVLAAVLLSGKDNGNGGGGTTDLPNPPEEPAGAFIQTPWDLISGNR